MWLCFAFLHWWDRSLLFFLGFDLTMIVLRHWLDKGQDFAMSFNFLGFVFSLSDQTVSVLEAKQIKNKGRVDSAVASFSGSRMTLRDIQKLFGALSHLSFVYVHMWTFLLPLSAFISSFHENPFAARYPPPSVISSLHVVTKITSGR